MTQIEDNMIIDTQEQLDIFNSVENDTENLLIQAYAGTGKSSTIIKSINYIPKDKSIIFLAFNKHIQEELKTKLPEYVYCFTTYGLGLSSLKRKYKDIEFDEFKIDKIINKKKTNWKLEEELKNYANEYKKYIDTIKKAVDLCRLSLAMDIKSVQYVCDKYEFKYNETKDIKRILSVLEACMNDNKTYDYVDMVFKPAIDPKIWMFQYDYVFNDEIQDYNRCQERLLEKIIKRDRKTNKITGRFINVGDQHQCQPIGTKILMSDGLEKNIEDININDKVVSYDRHEKGFFIGFYKNHRWGGKSMYSHGHNVDDVQKRIYNDKLIVINSDNKTTKYTYNHKCLVRLREDKINIHFLYIMEKNGYFRIGIAPLWSKSKINFSGHRANQEDAEKLWILNIYNSKFEAYIDEQFYSIKHSIPQMVFLYRDQKGNIKQNHIDDYYSRFDKYILKQNVNELFTFFKRKYNYPFWEKHTKNYFSKNHMFEINACNIIPEIMQMIIFDENYTKNIRDKYRKGKDSFTKVITAKYCNINDLYYEDYNDYVYSLKIHKHEVYVADGILTHNSIYNFAGSDENSFNWFKKFPNTKILPLSTTFRCAKNIVNEAQKIVPGINAMPNAPDGIVREGNVLEEANSGDFVLCRTTAPLVKLFFYYLLKHKKATIKGSDIGISLNEMIGDFKNIDKLIEYWNNEIDKYKNDIINKGMLNYEENGGYMALYDKVSTLMFLTKMFNNIPDLKNGISKIFSEKIEGIVLSTVHRCKGLESYRVFIIRPDLLPMKTSSATQYAQEMNLKYIAITRARYELIYDNEYNDLK